MKSRVTLNVVPTHVDFTDAIKGLIVVTRVMRELQPARHGGAVDQGRGSGHPLDAPLRHRFRANEVRLLLAVIAYNLGNLLRRLVLPVAIQSWSLTSLQQRLFKTGGRLIRHARYFILQLAESQ